MYDDTINRIHFTYLPLAGVYTHYDIYHARRFHLGVGERAERHREKVEGEPQLVEQRQRREDFRWRQRVSQHTDKKKSGAGQDRGTERRGGRKFSARTDRATAQHVNSVRRHPGFFVSYSGMKI